MRALSPRVRSLLLLLCIVLAAFESGNARSLPRDGLVVRQGSSAGTGTGTGTGTGETTGTGTGTGANTGTGTGTGTTTTTTANTATDTTTTTQNTQNTQQTTNTTPTQTTNTATTTQTTPTATQNTNTTPTDTTDTAANTNTAAQLTSTNTLTATEFVNGSDTASTSSASASATSTSDDSSDSGIKTSTIIGLSVAGGVAVLGVIGFMVWKFTRKRYGDFDDEPIKWPELNMHGENLNYALPTNRAKEDGAGAGTGLDNSSESDLTRNPSGGAYSQQSQYSQPTAADSSADLYAPGADPYAVPPLPNVNPNQPYRDDPNAYGTGFYDPYSGPVPHTFNDAASMDSHAHVGYGGEAIPMNTLAAGRRSPGPQMAYDGMGRVSPQPPMAGRQSPGPSVAYNAAGYGGRQSPGPAAALGGRQSPGPGAALGTGRQSPGPNAAYGGGY